ncbi:MAG: hypothetical protein Fur0018_19280 [Anaerolineales bacterium]
MIPLSLPPVLLLSAPIIAAIFTLVLTFILWTRRQQSGGTILFWVMVWMATASTTEALEIITFNPALRITYLPLEYSARLIMMTYWFIFIWEYTHSEGSLPRWAAGLIWGTTLAGILLNFTNAYHHLSWTSTSWTVETLFTSLRVKHGIGLALQESWIFLLGLLGVVLLLRKFYGTRGLLRAQVSSLLIGSLVLEIGFLLETGHINPIAPLDPLPIAVILGGLLLTWSVLRQNLLVLPLVAREQILDRIPVLVMALDDEQRILDLNTPMEAALNRPANRIIGKSAQQILWPEVCAHLAQKHTHPTVIAIGEVDNERYYEISLTPLQPITGHLLLMRDITREHMLQKEARSTDARLRSFLENSPDPLLIKDPQGGWVFANQAMLTLFGLQDTAYAGKRDEELADLVPQHRTTLMLCRETDHKAWADGTTYHGDEIISTPDGQLRIFDVIKTPRYTAQGTPLELFVQARDITLLKKAEQNLRQYAVRLQLLLEISADMNTCQTPVEVYAYLCKQSVELLAADGGRLYLNIPQNQQLECAYDYAVQDTCAGLSVPYGEDIAGNVAHTRKTLLIENYPDWVGQKEAPADQSALYHSVIGAPVLWQDELQAVLLVYRQKPQPPFTQDDLELLTLLTNQASGVMKGAHLLENESTQRQLAESVRQIALHLNTSLELSNVYNILLEEVRKLVPYDSATIMALDGDTMRIVASKGYDAFLSPAQQPYLSQITFSLKDTPNLLYITTMKRGLVIPDVLEDPEWVVIPEGRHIRSWIGMPIFIQGEIALIFSLDNTVPRAYQKTHLNILEMFTNHAGLAIQNARLFEQIRSLALNDELTDLPNRRYLFTMGKREVQRAQRFGHPLSAVMIDIDHFKRVNDTYGHMIGDEVLRVVAERCRNVIRDVDVIGRYGGEEFGILLPDTPLAQAIRIAERLRNVVADTPLPTSGGKLSLTVSLGVAELRPDINDLQDLLDTADQGLYMAKQNGRNRTMSIQNINPLLTNF